MDLRKAYVQRTVEERGVRFVRLWFVDVLGALKSLAVPVSELDAALEEGVGVDGSALEGAARKRERDVIAMPDPGTFALLPWRGGDVARMFCSLEQPGGAPAPADSRAVLARVLESIADLGWTAQVGAELEFFLFADDGDGAAPRPLDAGNYFDLTPLDEGSDFRRRTIDLLEQLGIPVKASHHEVGPSQHEIQLAHTDALSMADAITTFRLAVKEVASELGVFATFMPKPLERHAGSGMHLHLSLFDGSRNAFFSPDPGEPLSALGRQFLAGLLAHAGELTLLTNQWVNSYKRLANGFEAPRHVLWTRTGGAGLVRVPSNRPDRESAARIELRSPDPGANPYLACALILAAGLRGIERGYQLAPEEHGGVTHEAPLLPSDLREATDAFASSELARETLGDALVDLVVANKRAEWDAYQSTVTQWELERFLRSL
ncbi:glutamine synthetase family protein [Conexibacter sp. SYSU D00693]|uniref:glutamine synthetase family protein n=1 Tax=Conexibacter sp. SYSU D00693 TaxID=2812560 RepID=UPI00196A570A|nr:glutamine synthetase family protein [Conexibacter sp. SYSU D00693]